MNRNYRIGYHFEHYVVAPFLRGHGYYVMESRGSHGLADLIAVPEIRAWETILPVLFVQCKKGKYKPSKANYDKIIKHHHKWKGVWLMAYGEGRKTLKFTNMDKEEITFG